MHTHSLTVCSSLLNRYLTATKGRVDENVSQRHLPSQNLSTPLNHSYTLPFGLYSIDSIQPTPRQNLEHPSRHPISNQPSKDHKILRHDQKILAHLASRGVLELRGPERFALLAAARNGPEQQIANVAGDDGWEGVEGLGGGTDDGDGGAGAEGEDVEGVDNLWGVSSLTGSGGWEYCSEGRRRHG